jgi:hypothetical protein
MNKNVNVKRNNQRWSNKIKRKKELKDINKSQYPDDIFLITSLELVQSE